MKTLLALQLWSVKGDMEKDYKNTLKKVAELGFNGVEFAGFFDVKAEDMKACLDENGLKIAGSHTSIELLTDKLNEVISYNKTIGNTNIICPYYVVEDEKSLNTLIETLKPISKKLKENNLNLYYHNHAHEFIKINDEYALDTIYSSVEDIKPEIDTYWVFNAGLSPVEYCKKYNGVCDLIHLKDGTKTTSTAIGEGEVDIQSVIDVAHEINAKWLVMEDETKDANGADCGFDSVKIGMNNLKTKYKL